MKTNGHISLVSSTKSIPILGVSPRGFVSSDAQLVLEECTLIAKNGDAVYWQSGVKRSKTGCTLLVEPTGIKILSGTAEVWSSSSTNRGYFRRRKSFPFARVQ